MKELLITVYGGGDDAVAAVERMGDDWRAMLEQAASEVEQLRAERRWIPVSERLPVVGGRYLVLIDSSSDPFVDVVTWSRGVWWRGMSPAEEWGMDITHWMPLPEPPEVK